MPIFEVLVLGLVECAWQLLEPILAFPFLATVAVILIFALCFRLTNDTRRRQDMADEAKELERFRETIGVVER